MAILDEYNFVATIKGIGVPPSGKGWMMTLDWKLPGSKFDLVLYGQDKEDIQGWAVGDQASFLIERGNLKNGKSGQYHSDFYWNLRDICESSDYHPPAFTKTGNPVPVTKPTDDVQTRIAWNSAVNNAVHLYGPIGNNLDVLQNGEWISETTRDIKDLAEIIYHIIIAGPPVEPAEFLSEDALRASVVTVQPPEQGEPTQSRERSIERPYVDPVEALRESVRTWNHDHADEVIGTEEILLGLDVLFKIKTKNAPEGVSLLTPEQLLEMQGLIARGEYFDKLLLPEETPW